MIGVYKIENKINKNTYIGSSKCIEKRWSEHMRLLNNNSHHCIRFQNDWNKFDISNFNFSVVEICKEKDLIKREQYYIDYYFEKNIIYNTNLIINKNISKLRNNKTYIPYGCFKDTQKLISNKIILYILNKIIKEKSNYVHFRVNEFSNFIGSKSNNMKKVVIDNINSIKNNYIFKNITIYNNVISVVLNEVVYNSLIKKKKCCIINKSIYELCKTKCSKTLNMLIYLLNNKKYINCNINELKEILNIDTNKYNQYGDFKKYVLLKIKEDIENLGYKLNIEEVKNGRITNELIITIS